MSPGFVLSFVLAGTLGASQEASLDDVVHAPAPCMGTDDFPLIEVSGTSAEAARRLKGLAVRFRAEDDPGWYEVPLQSTGGAVFHAVLPKPLPEAVRVRYYVLAEKTGRRSTEYVVNVLMGGCPGARSQRAAPSTRIPVTPRSSRSSSSIRTERLKYSGPLARSSIASIGGESFASDHRQQESREDLKPCNG